MLQRHQAASLEQQGLIIDRFKQHMFNSRTGGKDLICYDCDVQCNSDLQYEVHILSTKHKARVVELNQPAALAAAVADSSNEMSNEVKSEPLDVSMNGLSLNDTPAATTDENNNTVVDVEVKPKKCKI
jgi:hypothetical protein